jgi:hypothetical protein
MSCSACGAEDRAGRRFCAHCAVPLERADALRRAA